MKFPSVAFTLKTALWMAAEGDYSSTDVNSSPPSPKGYGGQAGTFYNISSMQKLTIKRATYHRKYK